MVNPQERMHKLEQLQVEDKKLIVSDGDRSIINVGIQLYNSMTEVEKREEYFDWFYNKVTRDIIFRAPESMFEEWRCLCNYLEENFSESIDGDRLSQIISGE